MIQAVEELRRYLQEERGQRHRFRASRVPREARRLLNSCDVDGQIPASEDDMTAVLATLRGQEAILVHAPRWEAAGFPIRRDALLSSQLRELDNRYVRLTHLSAIQHACNTIEVLLTRQGIRLTGLNNLKDLDDLRDAIPGVPAALMALKRRQALTQFQTRLPRPTAGGSQELDDLRNAVRNGDAAGYRAALARLDAATSEQRQEQRCNQLLERLRSWHPGMAAHLAETPTDPRWEERLRSLPEAMSWLTAKAFCDASHLAPLDSGLGHELDEIQMRLERETAQLATARAWLHLATRATEQHRQALRQCHAAMKRIGKGTGIRAPANRRAARAAMREVMEAVPAWIMPVRKVAEIVPPQQDMFDVVIVDEASQSGLDATFLLWLAPRVIAVGDDQQCAPGSNQKHERYLDQLAARLPGLPEHQAVGLSPDNSLYDLLSVQFPAQVMLKEHFRSMPEIIEWSSRLFYGEELVPLRQFDPDRLPPLQVVQTDDGVVDGRDENIKNEPEAKHLVETLKQLLDDTAYTSPPKSFSIIALQGKSQAKLIRKLIDTSFSQATIIRHNIRVGDPPDFQGAESDVVMLSMIVTRPYRSLTAVKEKRRFNVAATRAKDQMWLFTSVDRSRLQSDDLRTSLLKHMEDPPSNLGHSPAAEEVSDSRLQNPFDKVFEQQVFRAIRQRGYHVTAQHKVGDYYIDLIVSGEGRKLAVECDGRIKYAEPDQLIQEFIWERKLLRAGWTFRRIAESDFARDPEQALAPLWEELAGLGIFPDTNADGSDGESHIDGGSDD